MLKEIKKIKSGKKELKEFGLVVGLVFLLIGVFLLWKRIEHFYYFLTIGFVLVFFGLLFPLALKPLQKVWMTLALILGYIMTRIILGVLFYTIVTPIGIFTKLLGKDILDTDFKMKKDSYWIPKDKSYSNKENYEKQY